MKESCYTHRVCDSACVCACACACVCAACACACACAPCTHTHTHTRTVFVRDGEIEERNESCHTCECVRSRGMSRDMNESLHSYA